MNNFMASLKGIEEPKGTSFLSSQALFYILHQSYKQARNRLKFLASYIWETLIKNVFKLFVCFFTQSGGNRFLQIEYLPFGGMF